MKTLRTSMNCRGKFSTTMGISEAQLQVDAFVKLRAACHGLVEHTDKIHVTVSLFDDSGARDTTATPIETYTKVFELRRGWFGAGAAHRRGRFRAWRSAGVAGVR